MRERLASVRERLGRMEVRAPVAGEVFGMKVFALREVVRPGEPILHIVPGDADLMVLAQLSPIHVDQVRPGQEAVLRFSAFPARVTPKFEGRITRVSADAVQDPQSGAAWYEVEVAMGAAIEPEADTEFPAWAAALLGTVAGWLPELPESWNLPDWLRNILPGAEDTGGMAVSMTPDVKVGHARDLSLSPGMPVEVHIRIADRSPLSYLAKPFTDYFSRSLREE